MSLSTSRPVTASKTDTVAKQPFSKIRSDSVGSRDLPQVVTSLGARICKTGMETERVRMNLKESGDWQEPVASG